MDIQQIVQLVVDKKFTTKELWYANSVSTQRDESVPLVEPGKELKGVMTELVVYEFLNTSSQLCKFISLVYNSFNDAIRMYTVKKQISDFDVFFIYKGGNILRFISNQAFYMLPGKVKDDLIAYYRDAFKKSDADFSIYINPKLDNFEEIFDDMTILSYLVQNYLRNIFIKSPKEYFNYYSLDDTSKKVLLNKYLEKLNTAEVIKQQTIPGTFVSLSLPDVNTNDNEDTKYIPKKDSETVFDKVSHTLETGDVNNTDKISIARRVNLRPIHLEDFEDKTMDDLSLKQLQIYGNISQSEMTISINRTTTFLALGGIISFNLVRTKILFNALRQVGNEFILDKIDGELIDVGITNKKDYSVKHFFDNVGKYIAEYKLEEDQCVLPFRAYSIEYLIDELENMLFLQNKYPWEVAKYAKRLKRLLFMYYLSLFLTPIFKNNNERIDYLTTLKKSILDPANNYNLANGTEILASINNFNNTYGKKYAEMLAFKNLIRKISELVADKNIDLEKYKIFIGAINENVDILQKSLVDLSQYMTNSGKMDEDNLYEGQLGGQRGYFYKYFKYKNKYLELKNKLF